MTVLTLPARPGHDITPPPVPWRRMVWVTWRQHRATMISVPAVLGGGQLRIAGEVEDLLATHRVLTGPTAEADRYASQLPVVQVKRAAAQAHLLVRSSGTDDPVLPGWEAHPVSLEELTLAYLRAPHAEARQKAANVNHTEPTEVAR